MQPLVNVTHTHSHNKTTTTVSTAPDDGVPLIRQEIRTLSGGDLADALLHSIMELDIEQQTIVLAKIRELKALHKHTR